MRQVEVEYPVCATPERVIAAFLEIEALRAWWQVERALVEPKAGGVYAVAWGITDCGFQYVTTGVIGTLDPARRLRIENYTYFHPERDILGPMILTVEAEPGADGQTSLRIIQDGYQRGADWDWYYEAVRRAWPQVGKQIVQYLERGPSV